MADLARHHFGWVGNGFHPGVEHHWWFGPIAFGDVVQVTAHPVQRDAREAMVKDVRTRIDADGRRTLRFTVRNTGDNAITGYGLDFSIVSD
jgi:hypothetical protein